MVTCTAERLFKKWDSEPHAACCVYICSGAPPSLALVVVSAARVQRGRSWCCWNAPFYRVDRVHFKIGLSTSTQGKTCQAKRFVQATAWLTPVLSPDFQHLSSSPVSSPLSTQVQTVAELMFVLGQLPRNLLAFISHIPTKSSFQMLPLLNCSGSPPVGCLGPEPSWPHNWLAFV